MKKNKILPVILSLTMLATAFTGCGNKAETPAATTDNAATEAPATEAPATEAPAPAADIDISEPVTLKWWLHGSNVTDDKAVLEEANKYLGEKLNVTLEPIWGTWGDFDENVVLSINGGDDVDIYFTCSWSANEYNAFAKKGAFMNVTDMVPTYAADLWALLPEVLTTGANVMGADGLGVYAIPGYKDIATQNCWDINVDLLTEYGYTLDDIKNTDFYGFGDILKTVKEGEGKDFFPLLIEGMVLERMVTNSIIVTGDSGVGPVFSYYLNPADLTTPGVNGNKIVNKYETPEYKKFAEKVREYYQAGYIDPAMANAQQANEKRNATQLAAKYLIGTQSYALGYEATASSERGIEVAFVPCTDPYVDTTSSQGAMMAISSTCKNPERALMFLNLLNTDPYLMTLLNYGVEDVHYTTNDDTTITFTDKRADYQPWTNGMGNVTLLPPQEAQGVDFQKVFKDYYGAAKEIPVLGYSFDPANVQTEVGALANVVAEYALALNTGAVDPAEKLDEFNKKLKDNGIDKVIEEANTQLDAFLAAKGN